MEPKYSKEQKIKIIEVKNEHGNMKYPEIQEHVNKNGIILDSYFIPMRGIEGTTLEGEIYDTYLYQIRLDDGTILEAINEDSLAVIDK